MSIRIKQNTQSYILFTNAIQSVTLSVRKGGFSEEYRYLIFNNGTTIYLPPLLKGDIFSLLSPIRHAIKKGESLGIDVEEEKVSVTEYFAPSLRNNLKEITLPNGKVVPLANLEEIYAGRVEKDKKIYFLRFITVKMDKFGNPLVKGDPLSKIHRAILQDKKIRFVETEMRYDEEVVYKVKLCE